VFAKPRLAASGASREQPTIRHRPAYNRKTDQAAGLIDFSYVLVGNVAYGLNGRNHFLGVRLPMPSIAPTSLSSIPSSSMLYKYW